MSFSVAVCAFLSAYIPVLGAYTHSTVTAASELNKLSRKQPSVASSLQTQSRGTRKSTIGSVPSSTDSSEPSSSLSPLASQASSSRPATPKDLPTVTAPVQFPSPVPSLSELSASSSKSSSSSSSSDAPAFRNHVMSSQAKFAVLEQDSPSKVPLLLPGNVTPGVMRAYEHACLGYFDTKDIAVDKQVRKVLPGLRDNRIMDWVTVHRERLIKLTFPKFMEEFKVAYLPKDWEDITHIELLQLNQNSSTFWDFSVAVQYKNSLLASTPSHMTEDQLHRIESGMNPKLALRVRLEKGDKYETLDKWLTEIRRIDDLIRAERADFDALTKATREGTRRANTLAELSRRTNSKPASVLNTASGSRPSLPKLTSVEHQLIYDNEGCLKCRRVFTDHQSASCPNDFPDPATYKVLTQSFVNYIKRKTKKVVASVTAASNNEDASASHTTAPITAVMEMSINPAGYMATNTTSVIEGDSMSGDRLVRPPPFITAMSRPPLPSTPKAPSDDLAPLTVPHLYWQCAISGTHNEFPVVFAALIDHGSHTVLISDIFATLAGTQTSQVV